MEIDTIKISELAEGTTINNDSILVYNLNGQTKKITFQNLKNAVISALASEVSQLDADLDAEVSARTEADTTLAGDITAEATARAASDTALAGDISAEAEARTAADTVINNTFINSNNTSLLNNTNNLINFDTTKYPSGVTNHTTGASRYTKIGSLVFLYINLKSTTTGQAMNFTGILPPGYRPANAPHNFVISDGGITGHSLVNLTNTGDMTIYFGPDGYAQGIIVFPAFN